MTVLSPALHPWPRRTALVVLLAGLVWFGRDLDFNVHVHPDEPGKVRQILEGPGGDIFGEGVMLAEMEIPVTPPTTAYMRVGELFSYLCLGVTMAAIGTAAVRRRGK